MWSDGKSPLTVAVDLLRVDAPEDSIWAPQKWARWKVLLPHVLAVLEHAEPDSAEVAWLQDRAGTHLQARGHAEQGRELLEQALTSTETIHGPAHPDVATRLHNLAMVLMNLDDAEAARPLIERALQIQEAARGPDGPSIALLLSTLAQVLTVLEGPAAARPLAERAVAIAIEDPDHFDLGVYAMNLAFILSDLGELEDARSLAESALTIGEAEHGPDSPTVVGLLRLSSVVLLKMGDTEAARQFAERAVVAAEAVHSPHHPDVAACLDNLAHILRYLDEDDAAQPLAERARRITEQARLTDE